MSGEIESEVPAVVPVAQVPEVEVVSEETQAARVLSEHLHLHPIEAMTRVKRLLSPALVTKMAACQSREEVYDVLDEVQAEGLEKQQAAIAAMGKAEA